MSATVAVLVGYLATLAALAIWSRKETHSLKGYYLAGKKLPYWVVAFSTNATGESGWLLLGLTGMGYAVGAQAYWVIVGEMIGIWLSWTLISRRLKRLSDETDSITVPDVLAAPFDDRLHVIRAIAVLIIVLMVTTYVSAQMVATGKAFSGFVELDYRAGVIVGAIIIISYTIVGGYKAVSYTDVVQGVLMLAGLIIVPIVAINAAGGWSGMTATLDSYDPAFTDMFAVLGTGTAGWVAVISFAAIGLPFLGVPQLLVRYMSARDEGELKKARLVSITVLFIFLFGAVTAGIAGRALFPNLADSELVFPTLASELFHPLLTGVLLVIVLSAIMSTVDSLLLLASSSIVRDTMQKMLGNKSSEARLAGYGKIVTVIIGVIAVFVALFMAENKLIFWFVLFSWSGLGAAFGPTILLLLLDKRTTGPGVAAGMLGGFLTSIIWVQFIKADAYGLYEAIPGFIVGALATIIVSRLTPRAPAPV
jgi:sodium/proline symporter